MTNMFAAVLAIAIGSAAAPAEPLHVYGPGGPAPAIKEAAKAFERQTGRKVEVVAGPTPQWIARAKADGDVIYSGSENMMSDFVKTMEGSIDAREVRPLYLRPSSILVREGNPKKIKGLVDLFKPGRRVIVVHGAGQNGLWEDMAGRTGEIAKVRALRRNIVAYAGTSAEARDMWVKDTALDAWIIWNIWQVANPNLADVVAVEPQYRIYRDAGVVVTKIGKADRDADRFAAFLESRKGARIFQRHGWIVPK